MYVDKSEAIPAIEASAFIINPSTSRLRACKACAREASEMRSEAAVTKGCRPVESRMSWWRSTDEEATLKLLTISGRASSPLSVVAMGSPETGSRQGGPGRDMRRRREVWARPGPADDEGACWTNSSSIMSSPGIEDDLLVVMLTPTIPLAVASLLSIRVEGIK